METTAGRVVLPGDSITDVVDGHRRHSELLGKDSHGCLRIEEDFLDILLRELHSPLQGPPSVPESSHHIPNIILRSAKFQMFWVDAEPVVALVPDDHPLRDGTVVLHVDEPVEPDGGVRGDPDDWVPIIVQGVGDADVAAFLVFDVEDLIA